MKTRPHDDQCNVTHIYIGFPRLQTGKQRPEQFARLHQSGIGIRRTTAALTLINLRRTLEAMPAGSPILFRICRPSPSAYSSGVAASA
jgi:hypothetical protein